MRNRKLSTSSLQSGSPLRVILLCVLFLMSGAVSVSAQQWRVSYENHEPTGFCDNGCYIFDQPDEQVTGDHGPIDLGLPADVDLTGYAEGLNGRIYLAVDQPTEIGGIAVDPRDVVMLHRGTASLAFAGFAFLPEGLRVDAVAVDSSDFTDRLYLSFDNTTKVFLGDGSAGSFVVDDEDIVMLDGSSGFQPAVDGSAVGIPTNVDIDGVHLEHGTGRWIFSIDIGAQVVGIDFSDNDPITFDPKTGIWSSTPITFGEESNDVDAMAQASPVIFADGFESDSASEWSLVVGGAP